MMRFALNKINVWVDLTLICLVLSLRLFFIFYDYSTLSSFAELIHLILNTERY